MTVRSAVATLDELIAARIAGVSAFRATVTAVSGSKVQIQRIGEDTPGTEQFATTSRFPLAVNDVVLCLPLGSKPVIIDVIRFSASLAAPSILTGPIFTALNAGTTAAGSPDASTTSTSTYAVGLTATWTLPDGTWTIVGIGGANFIHSASGTVAFYVEVDGSGVRTVTPNINSTVYTAWTDTSGPSTGKSGTITINLNYRSGTAGTTTIQQPWWFLTAWRTA
jgi:hypothetical protein